jgi:hypothetical protein
MGRTVALGEATAQALMAAGNAEQVALDLGGFGDMGATVLLLVILGSDPYRALRVFASDVLPALA